MSNESERYIDLSNLQTKGNIDLNYLANIFGKIKVNQIEMNPSEYLEALCFQSDNEQIELTSSQNEKVVVGFGHKKNATGLNSDLFELSFDQSSSNLTLKPKFKSEEYGHFIQDANVPGVSVNIPIQELSSSGATVEIPMDEPGTIKISMGTAVQAISSISYSEENWENIEPGAKYKQVDNWPFILNWPANANIEYFSIYGVIKDGDGNYILDGENNSIIISRYNKELRAYQVLSSEESSIPGESWEKFLISKDQNCQSTGIFISVIYKNIQEATA